MYIQGLPKISKEHAYVTIALLLLLLCSQFGNLIPIRFPGQVERSKPTYLPKFGARSIRDFRCSDLTPPPRSQKNDFECLKFAAAPRNGAKALFALPRPPSDEREHEM